MLNTIIWALLTGGITGGAWVAIVLTQRQKRVETSAEELLRRMEEMEMRLDEMRQFDVRLFETEERLDFAERLLSTRTLKDDRTESD